MADRIAIMGGEQYADWIKRDGNAQRLFKTYRNKWPEGDARCMAMGSEFYVRFRDGDGMRRVYNVGDFNDEDEWCAQCGTPIDPDNGEYYSCDVYDCCAVLCDYCGGSLTCDGYYCPQHRGAEAFMDGKEPEYVYPYASGNGGQFTFGVEIELESELSDDFVENVTNSDIIAGWDKDASLDNRNGIELQSNILDMSKLPALKRIVEGIPEWGENADCTRPNAVYSTCATSTTTIGAPSLMASTRASTLPSTTSTRTQSSCARLTVGMRAAPISLSRLSSGRAPCGASSKSTPAARCRPTSSNGILRAWPTT